MVKMKNQRKPINKYQQDGPNQLHFGSPVVFLISVGTLEDTETSGKPQTLQEWIKANESDLRYKSPKDIITHIVRKRFQRGIELATFLKDEFGKRQHNFTIRVLCPENRLPQIQCLGEAEGSYQSQMVQITYEQIVDKMFLPYTTTDNIVQITQNKTVAASSLSFLNSRPDALIHDVQKVIHTYSQPKSQSYLPKAKSPFMPALSETPGPAVESTPRVMWRHESHLDSSPTARFMRRDGSQMTRTERKIQTLQTLRSSRRNPCNCML